MKPKHFAGGVIGHSECLYNILLLAYIYDSIIISDCCCHTDTFSGTRWAQRLGTSHSGSGCETVQRRDEGVRG